MITDGSGHLQEFSPPDKRKVGLTTDMPGRHNTLPVSSPEQVSSPIHASEKTAVEGGKALLTVDAARKLKRGS